MTALLEIDALRAGFGGAEMLHGVSLAMTRERLGLVGGSGAGKSLIARAILRLLPPGAWREGRIVFDGIDLAHADMRALRGRRIGWIVQDPHLSLNPVMRVGAQIEEGLRRHRGLRGRAARAAALALIETVRLSEPARVHGLYPHELSGGMAQRAMIAMMLAGEPDLLIADEPTSALDASTALQVLDLLDELVARRGMGLLFISHDLRLVAGFCDRVAVIEAGRIVETCAADALEDSRHPYTSRLLAARPSLGP